MRSVVGIVLVFAVTLLWVSHAAAETSPLKEQGTKTDGAIECPPLIQTKYPFLTCVKADSGTGFVFGGKPEILPTSEMPPLDPYVESVDKPHRNTH